MNIIEAILFASGEAIEEDIFREKLQVSKIEMDKAIRKLEVKYSGENGIHLLNFNHKLQLATNPEYKEAIASVLTPIREKEFTATILECAAIIAYKQPITRTELEKIRNGRSSDYAITTLMTLDMIEPVGRKDSPGKPVLYGTSDSFLKRFKLKSIKDLPDYEEFLQKLAEISSWESLKPADDEGYLYEKDVYNPEEDEEMQPVKSVSEEIAVAAEEAPVDVAD
ncbi:MAG: SMC-Scp complex subunit ScpB [Clostridia bacterium]|nr:SMC-Scp complex subunit ScpB [Clostridia bacterium]